MCVSNGLLWYIRVIFLILARAIVMELVLLLCYGGKGISSSFLFAFPEMNQNWLLFLPPMLYLRDI